jgi:predicted NBD/HSP70 family sugar kinase
VADGAGRVLPQSALRAATDRTLFEQVIAHGRVTRAELAAATGISKPTVSESVRRLTEGGLLAASGPRETGRRGRVGTYYELHPDAGWVLGVAVDQSGIRAWRTDLAGRRRAEHTVPPGPPGDPAALAAALRSLADALGHNGLRAVGVSTALPVHPESHTAIRLPGSPFPEGHLDVADALGLPVPVLVDNDVNLAALAEQRDGAAAGRHSFGYVYAGGGLGLGLCVGDRLIRGAHGLAGEIGYLPGSPGAILSDAYTAPGRPAADVPALLAALDTGRAPEVVDVLTRAVAALVAVVDPEVVLLGGPVGTHPALLPAVRTALPTYTPAPVTLLPSALGATAPLHGATHLALDHARTTALHTAGLA